MCSSDGFISKSCAIDSALTFIPVGKIIGWTGRIVPKRAVLNFFGSSIAGMFAGTIGRAVDDLFRLGKLSLYLKPIKSIDLVHIIERHAYETTKYDVGKYLQNANIEAVIREAYGKSGKKLMETTSDVLGKTIPSIEIEVDMGRKIGTNLGGNKSYSIIRMIVDFEGNIISAYPVANFKPYNL